MSQEKMTRKEALATLHMVYEDWRKIMKYEQWEQSKSLFNQAYDAFAVLARGILGPSTIEQYSSLCQKCHMHYVERIVQEKGNEVSTWCCATCGEQLKAEQKLEEETGEQ